MLVLIIDKNGEITEKKIKNVSFDNLYKKCNYKTEKYFSLLHEFNNLKLLNNNKLQLYGKSNGRAGSENKYDFPPPIDNVLYFGTLIMIQVNDDGKIIELKKQLWDKIYNHLFKGFEDLSTTAKMDELEIDELDYIDDKYKTKEGYLKDGFIVSDNVEDDEDDDDDSESYHNSDSDNDGDTESYDKKSSKKLTYSSANKMIKKNIKKKITNNEIQIIQTNDYTVDDESDIELSCDEYVFSDE